MKRLLDCNASDFKKMNREEILKAIQLSEGRVLVSEIIGAYDPTLHSISNAELVSAFGADMLLLNMIDVYDPVFKGIPQQEGKSVIQSIKELTGRLVGINLEPLSQDKLKTTQLSKGRIANKDTAKRALELGVDYIVLTGNPSSGVDNQTIVDALKDIRSVVKDDLVLAAGKMHASGSLKEAGENIVTVQDVGQFIDAGADIILLPAPGTVPGITQEYIQSLVQYAHQRNTLTLTAIGTSQEDADEETIRQIAMMCKMTGTDIHHIGDAGYKTALPENIMTYSIAIRGKRHTYIRMARSTHR